MKKIMFAILFVFNVLYADKFEDLLAKAKKGNVNAQLEVGKMYYNTEPKDYEQSCAWLSEAEMNGSRDATFFRKMLEGFMGKKCVTKISSIGQNLSIGGENITKEQDEQTGYNEGAIAYKKRDYKTAYKAWHPLAQKGNSDAQYSIGMMHEEGRGIAVDKKEAFKWFLKAAERGVGHAQTTVANYYRLGIGVEQNEKEAARWENRAIEQYAKDVAEPSKKPINSK
jgi:uncharacterized protein